MNLMLNKRIAEHKHVETMVYTHVLNWGGKVSIVRAASPVEGPLYSELDKIRSADSSWPQVP